MDIYKKFTLLTFALVSVSAFADAPGDIPAGDKDLLKRKRIKNVYEFEWWESFKDDDIEFTFTPVQHWSKRGLFDRNKSLWGGWHISTSDYSLYHAGDTGYSKDFIDTKVRLGSPKYAFIPIGAYDPEWFMAASHVNPEDAVMPAWIVWQSLKGIPLNKRPTLVSTIHGLYSVNFYSAIMSKPHNIITVSKSANEYLVKNYPKSSDKNIKLIYRGLVKLLVHK